MGKVLELKTVFISGPSDAEKEMELIAMVISSLNRVLCPSLFIRLDPTMGTTHARAGTGRPQERINPLVRECDLFIGVFKREFGSDTGEYESGSEEEFRIAFERNKQSKTDQSEGIPEILLFLYDIPEDEKIVNNPTLEKQIQMLTNFKEDIRKHLLYIPYENDIQLLIKCYDQIIQWLLAMIKKDDSNEGDDVNE